ncbi:MAG: WG repeat-containing protein [Bacteroidales bacterium]|nr:WG repeat-containing protein [Bacteroidales bacterium]
MRFFLIFTILVTMFGCFRKNDNEISFYKKDQKIGLKRGTKKITEPIFDKLKMPFDSATGTTQAFVNGKWGIIDTTGKTIIPFSFDSIQVTNKYILTQNSGLFALYDLVGNIILPLEYSSITPDLNGNFVVALNNKYGVVTKINDTVVSVIPLQYDLVKYDGSIYYFVYQNNKTGIIDNAGKILLETNYEEVMEIAYLPEEHLKLFKFTLNGKQGIITGFGDLIVKPEFDFIETFVKKIARVQSKNKWGFIGIRGEVLVEPIYDQLAQFGNDGTAQFLYNGRKGFLERKQLFQNAQPHLQNRDKEPLQ